MTSGMGDVIGGNGTRRIYRELRQPAKLDGPSYGGLSTAKHFWIFDQISDPLRHFAAPSFDRQRDLRWF